MSRVFITQIPHRRDAETTKFIPTVNVTPAEEHGEIVVLLPYNASFYATAGLVDQLKQELKSYDFDAGDSIVALGDPSIMAVTFGLLGRLHGKFWLLKWDKQMGRYSKTKIVL